MDIIRLTYPFSELPVVSPQTLAIGFFDGVHSGHQELFRRTIEIARSEGIAASVITFDPHPRKMLGGHENWQYITPLQEKLARLAECGLDRCYILNFDRTLSQLTPEQFVDEILIPLQAHTAVVGFNFTFGHLGRGTTEQLRALGGSRMKVQIIRPYEQDGVRVSSTIIREHIRHGRIEQANELLGRPYFIAGEVVHGFGRGRTIGIPTANIEPNERFVIPGNGVYAVRIRIGDELFGAVMNIGVKPTFENDPDNRTLEAHILSFDRMIYGAAVQVSFIRLIRSEQKFASVDALITQIRADIKQAEAILASG